jgi:hypothetical protein
MWHHFTRLFLSIPGCKKYSPVLLLIFMVQSTVSMAMPQQQTEIIDTVPPQLFTVANIVAPPDNKDYYVVTFFESARFYKLMRNNKHCAKSLPLLQQSKKNNKPVQVYLTQAFGDTIKCVTLPTKKTKG